VQPISIFVDVHGFTATSVGSAWRTVRSTSHEVCECPLPALSRLHSIGARRPLSRKPLPSPHRPSRRPHCVQSGRSGHGAARQVWVGNGLLPKRGFLERHRVEPPEGTHQAMFAFTNPRRVVASAASEGIASGAAAQNWVVKGRYGSRFRTLAPAVGRCRSAKRSAEGR
jgi:hypothetical protein